MWYTLPILEQYSRFAGVYNDVRCVMTYLKAILLGLVQGIAEFLPISSSGHLAIARNLLNMEGAGSIPEFFDVLLHLGTLIAVFAAYWGDIRDMVVEFFRGIRDLAHDINSPGEATDLITKLMQWTDERRIHIHTVLHLNKGDDNTRGHLGTELNNKAETVLQITKDDFDRDVSSVAAMHIRDRDFEPFAFRINADALPEPVKDYQFRPTTAAKSFDYAEVCEAKHREALELLFSEADRVSYSSLIGRLQSSYAAIGHSFGINKAKQLKVFLENKRMIVKEDKFYRYNPEFHY